MIINNDNRDNSIIANSLSRLDELRVIVKLG